MKSKSRNGTPYSERLDKLQYELFTVRFELNTKELEVDYIDESIKGGVGSSAERLRQDLLMGETR